MQAQYYAHAPPRATSLGRLAGAQPPIPSASWMTASRESRIFSSYKLESAGSLRAETSMHHAAKSTSHNADNATSVGIRAGRPARGLQHAVVRAHTHHAHRRAAPLSLARGRAGAWGHVSSPVSTALYLSSFVLHAPPSDENHNYRIIATPSASTAGATPSASTAGAPPSASTAGTAPRVLLRHWTLPATASGHAFGSRTPCAYIRTCTRVRVHPLYSHPRPQPHAPAYGMVPRSRPRSSKLVGGQHGMHHGGTGRRPN